MDFNDYSPRALSTCMDSCRNITYPTFGAIEELGEFVQKLLCVASIDECSSIKHSSRIVLEQMAGIGRAAQTISKAVRHGIVDAPVAIDLMKLTPTTTDALKSEIGDVLWNLNLLCNQLGFTLDDAAQSNLQKLADRQKRNEIDANGDTVRTPIR